MRTQKQAFIAYTDLKVSSTKNPYVVNKGKQQNGLRKKKGRRGILLVEIEANTGMTEMGFTG